MLSPSNILYIKFTAYSIFKTKGKYSECVAKMISDLAMK